AYDRVAIAGLYPLESDSETKIAYTRFLHGAVAPLVDTEYSRDVLRKNCARDISKRVDDASFDPENKIVTTWLWDEESQDSVAIALPYEPGTNFAGCSESAKELLRHIQRISDDDTAEQMDMDTINATVEGDYSAILSDA
ncbi:hypothetical protein GWO43_16695, partial [candidate division KSB1 bacterium]|nr:hypothetical protein [candidate division KSB1 bacterium]NIS25586.1 hypothetical protein [candidate division KSB1 bacterium]NIT72481.1 hypothetical protein [candidate division KSB1 bacterium]NIU89690.1 hypothetical protein [candidate division KSB1 bacterium]NIW70620.1 hypothetical protein [candidate division KSB1 bacterium]